MIKNKDCSKRTLVFKMLLFASLAIAVMSCKTAKDQNQGFIQFIYTSDSHFGITRPAFQGDSNVYANIVNAAMVNKMNMLPALTLPKDSGVNAGNLVGGIDYVVNTGDIANREENGVQNATLSWRQFVSTYVNGITLKNNKGKKAELLILPGNHDISNAIGHYKIHATTDNASIVGIYNYMFPSTPQTSSSYNYTTNKIHYSKNISGVHFVFVNMWPDSSERVWIANDLKSVSDSTPVIMFAHDQPEVESKHFTNPNGKHDINPTDKFENLLPEVYKDGISDQSIAEQLGFVAFLRVHKNIKVYFHGNVHENKYYDYKDPDSDIDLKVIEVDSPMKGNVSKNDETKLSFQLVTIDTQAKKITVRECLWNSDPTQPKSTMAWGTNTTFSLK